MLKKIHDKDDVLGPVLDSMELEDESENEDDLRAVEEARHEETVPADEVRELLGITREELVEATKVVPIVKEKPKMQVPKPREFVISARKFVKLRKFRWERCAGFLLENKRSVRKTVAQWQVLWDTFWTRPVK